MDDKWVCESEVSKTSFALLLPVLLFTIMSLSFFFFYVFVCAKRNVTVFFFFFEAYATTKKEISCFSRVNIQ